MACVVKSNVKGSYAKEVKDRLTFVLANERGFFGTGATRVRVPTR